MALSDTLRQKRGPFPTWVWLALFVAALAGYLIYRNKQNAATAAAANTTGGTAPTNLGNTNLSNLVPSAYPMPYQGGDVFVNVPAGNSTSGGGSTSTGTGGKTPPTVKFQNQIHQVGKVGTTYNLADLVKQYYPNATPAQQQQIEYATIVNPYNGKYNLGSGKVPGGAKVEFYSQAVQ